MTRKEVMKDVDRRINGGELGGEGLTPMVVRKYLEEADENFRRAFGFIGSGELTIDQVMKGLE